MWQNAETDINTPIGGVPDRGPSPFTARFALEPQPVLRPPSDAFQLLHFSQVHCLQLPDPISNTAAQIDYPCALRCWQFMSENSVKWASMFSRSPNSILDLASYRCESSYSVEILSIDPLVIYLNNFLNDAEIRHLLNLGYDLYKLDAICVREKLIFGQSRVNYNSEDHVNLTVRRSQTALDQC
ncbi:hypothetical protein HRG_012243 [Hirsutella rhossiliensis]